MAESALCQQGFSVWSAAIDAALLGNVRAGKVIAAPEASYLASVAAVLKVFPDLATDTLEPLLLSAGIPKVASPRLLRFCTGLLENPHLSVDFERLWERLKTATAAVAAHDNNQIQSNGVPVANSYRPHAPFSRPLQNLWGFPEHKTAQLYPGARVEKAWWGEKTAVALNLRRGSEPGTAGEADVTMAVRRHLAERNELRVANDTLGTDPAVGHRKVLLLQLAPVDHSPWAALVRRAGRASSGGDSDAAELRDALKLMMPSLLHGTVVDCSLKFQGHHAGSRWKKIFADAGATVAAARLAVVFPKGMKVSCNWKNRGVWYPATVASNNSTGYSIHFDDGDEEVNVPDQRIRPCKQWTCPACTFLNPMAKVSWCVRSGSRFVGM